MGVQCRIVIYSSNIARAEESAKAAFARISEIDAAVSDYRVDSDVARLSAAAGNGLFVPVAPDTQFLLKRSLEVAHASGGAFDPTVGPVTKLWRVAKREHAMPDQSVIETAAGLVNSQNIDLKSNSDGDPAARLKRGGMALDFGAIAKGYAAEEAVKVIRAAGQTSCMVALSGDIFVGDRPPGSSGWRISIVSGQQRPDHPDAAVELENQGLSTSGDTEQFVEIGGKRFSHIIDPRQGWAISDQRSVTVIGPSGWMHDALATAMCVLNAQESQEFLNQYPQCAAVVFERSGDQVNRKVYGETNLLQAIEFSPK